MKENHIRPLLQDNCSHLWIVPQQYSGGAWDYPKATAVDKAYAQLTLRHLPTLPGTVCCCILDSSQV